MPSTSCDTLQGRCVPARNAAQFPIPTGLGVNYYRGRSHYPRELISGKCPAPLQAQGATGRHHQGNQEAQLLHEARRKAPGQRSAFAEATAQEAAARSGLASLFVAARGRTSENQALKAKSFGFLLQLGAASPKGPFPFPPRTVIPHVPSP